MCADGANSPSPYGCSMAAASEPSGTTLLRALVVVSAWVIETVADPVRAVQEYLRVAAPGGHVVSTFCSLPHGWFSRAGSALLREAVGRGFAGTFLAEQGTPWHDCELSHRRRFRGGLTTEVGLSACCSVGCELGPEVG